MPTSITEGPRPSTKDLMIFIPCGKSDTDQSGDDHKRKTAQTVDVKREGHCDSEDEIFAHMCKFADRIFDAGGTSEISPVLKSFNPEPDFRFLQFFTLTS